MFLLLKVVFILSQGFFSFSCPADEKAGGAQEAGRGHSQDSWPKVAKGIFHTKWRHAQYINWGELAGRGRWLLGDWLSISQRVVSNCVMDHLSFLGFYFTLFVTVLFVTNYYYYYHHYHCFSFLSVLLNCLYLNPWGFFFWFSSPSHWVGRSEWAAAWCLVASWG